MTKRYAIHVIKASTAFELRSNLNLRYNGFVRSKVKNCSRFGLTKEYEGASFCSEVVKLFKGA